MNPLPSESFAQQTAGHQQIKVSDTQSTVVCHALWFTIKCLTENEHDDYYVYTVCQDITDVSLQYSI